MSLLATLQALVVALTSVVTETALVKVALTDLESFLSANL